MNIQEKVKKRNERRKKSIKSKVFGTPERHRLNVFKSNTGIYAQVIDDTKGHTIVSASSIDKETKTKITKEMTNTAISKIVGVVIAERAIAKNINKVVFDRNGNIYTGRIKALADAAREKGLQF
ncbi:MAG: 50S ribosomal protein L18 [Bacteroidetes bacterium]|nr:50S ribosomal protein L18 [Bacteroidota bacterium]